MIEQFRPGVYRHYKGGRYLALFLTEDSNNRKISCDEAHPNLDVYHPDEAHVGESTQEPEVIYIHLDGPRAGQRCNRKLKQWCEQVVSLERVPGDRQMVPRFTWESP